MKPKDRNVAGLIRDFERSIPMLAAKTPQLADDLRERAAADLPRLLEWARDPDQHGAAIIERIRQYCTQGNLLFLLAAYQISHPSYDYFDDFARNAARPWDVSPEPSRLPESTWPVLGTRVALPVGVAACPLTTSAVWVEYYARLGFCVITFKTVRSAAHDANPFPNWVFLDGPNHPLGETELGGNVTGELGFWPEDPTAFSMANSFGVPSFAPEIWQEEIRKSIRVLREGQTLLVSVMGNFETLTPTELVDDFVVVSRLAAEAGARAIELNLSCPNGIDSNGVLSSSLVCDDHEQVIRIVGSVRRALPSDIRLAVKLAYMGSDPLARIVAGIAPHVDAISGINTIRMGVLDRAGAATFGSRPSAGVSGVAIRELGLKFVRRLVDLKRAEAYTFDVIGMGGVMTAADILAYLDAGATVVQSATGAFFNPYLAVDLREAMGAGIGGEAGLSRLSDLAPTAADVAVLAALRLGPASVPELSAATMMVPSEVRHTIARLIAAGLVSRNQVGLLALTKEGAGFDRNVRRGQPGIVAPSTEMPTVQELDDALDRVLARLT